VIGLVIVQYQYLRIGLNLANIQFNKNISKSVSTIQSDLSYNNKLTFLLGKAITNDATYFKTKLDSTRKAASYFLEDFLNYKLLENGIKTDFSYKLYVKDTSLLITSKNFNKQQSNSIKYPIQLKGYLPNLVNNNVVLELYFNKINHYFLAQLNGLTVPSLIFLAAIITVVFWVLKSFYWQQNIITKTNDFINNLTHELKTPVFSIGLATKMLQKNQDKKSKPFLDIIKNENDRLKEQVENVLQLANLERKNSSLKLIETNFHPHLHKLCENFKLISTIENVEFNFELKDKNYFLKCNPSHLTNTINNLLDNAKKYNAEPIKIYLTSEIKAKKLFITILDNGLGIDKKNHKTIFKKHYRIYTGNLHNTKGYGLGLYYVKKIIKLHKGKIKLISKLNEGTKITIILPIN
jgi:two-component system phosphate regulon sensor histidine kinase PhoR